MDLQQFVIENLWGIAMGCGGLLATVVTIRLNMKQFLDKLENLHIRVNGHGERLAKLEVAQADRIGYERGLAEAKQRMDRHGD